MNIEQAQDHLTRHRDAQKRWRVKNPEKYKAINARTKRRWVAANPERSREGNRNRMRVRTLKAQEAIAGPKPDKCTVCGEGGKIAFDHCHVGGHFRGWICGGCNLILGHAKDSPERLRALADYLERSRG